MRVKWRVSRFKMVSIDFTIYCEIKSMKAKDAVDWVEPERWIRTNAAERLALLKAVQANIGTHWEEMVAADCAMKGLDPKDQDNAHQVGTAMQATVVPLASNVAECIHVYEELIGGKMPQPSAIKAVGNGDYDIEVFPIGSRDKMMYADRKDYLRVRGEPQQVNPLEKDGGIIAVLGAGNYGSSFEVIRALWTRCCRCCRHGLRHRGLSRPAFNRYSLGSRHRVRGRNLPGTAIRPFTVR